MPGTDYFRIKPPTPTEQHFEKAIAWIRTHQERFWATLGTGVMAILLIVLMVRHRQLQNQDAWNQLGMAQGYLMQSQYDAAAKALEDWNGRFAGTNAASYAKFLKADLLYRTSDYAQSADIYDELALSAPLDLRPLALSAQASAEEMAGHLPQAQRLIQQFIDRYPDHFMAASMYLSQARLAEMTGNAASASATYDRFVILYPQSPWTAFAKARLQALSGASGAAPTPPAPAGP
jgi:tetratricopeptide (TPR) repeat protein